MTTAAVPPARPHKSVVVVDYDPAWPQRFAWLCAQLAPVVGDAAVAIEHVGSTSVPGLAAKPIIDIDVVVPTATSVPIAIERLARLGYQPLGELGIPGREALRAPRQGPLAGAGHNLYVCAADGEELHRHLAFRDYLRTHPEAVQAYAAVKREGAQLTPDDRDAYQDYKSPLVRELLRLALAAAGPPGR